MIKMLSSTTTAAAAADARYHFDASQLAAFKTAAPWMKNPKHFSSVAVSPTAVMKIMMHCQAGVSKGIRKGGNPIEVMGILLGRPDPVTPHTLVVTDAFALPIEGFETRVVADDEGVVNHMIALQESLEQTRHEKFMGWYHSHPFDLTPDDRSHCFLSQTDLTTQLQWQRAEDPHGNPFVAIVVDPLRSLHKQVPELKAFRAYPPEYNSPVANECPDGSIEVSDQVRLEHWGSCWNRYYELQIEYYMSAASSHVITTGLVQDSLWMRTLMQRADKLLAQQLTSTSKELTKAATNAAASRNSNNTGTTSGGGGSGTGTTSTSSTAGAATASSSLTAGAATSSSSSGSALSASALLPSSTGDNTTSSSSKFKEWNKAVDQLTTVAVEQLSEATLQETKRIVFS